VRVPGTSPLLVIKILLTPNLYDPSIIANFQKRQPKINMHSTIERAAELAMTQSNTNTILINPPKPSKTWRTRRNHVVMATLPGTRMNSCQDVREIYNECLVSHSNAAACKTAASYLSVCRNTDLEQ
jgi:hypothetical protein